MNYVGVLGPVKYIYIYVYIGPKAQFEDMN